MPELSDTPWSVEEARELYGVRGWGAGYFDVSPDGMVVVTPRGDLKGPAISMMDLVRGLRARGLQMPVLLRFVDILASRIRDINESFQTAISEAGYEGGYRGVYPIKVNQQQQVVEEIVRFGRDCQYGLEAGSKAELIAALAYLEDPGSLLVCNGYKDEEFIDLALSAGKMGFRVVLVLEMPGEVELVLQRAEALGVDPLLGVRAKLSAQGGGHWNHSGGDRSTFGLNSAQIIDVVDLLRERGRLDCLRMLHYHLGSQIPNIRSVRHALTEGAQFYGNLVREGAPMGFFDVGGGLAVDYDGSHTDHPSSSNYTLDEYAADVVEAVMAVVNGSEIPAPVIVTEAGRATVAHHSVLLFNVLDVSRLKTDESTAAIPEDAHELLLNLCEVDKLLDDDPNLQECYHDAVHYRDELRRLFEYGEVSLRERAMGDRLFWRILSRIVQLCRSLERVPEELQALDAAIVDVYHGNFSVFQSLPDAWAIDQLFPVMPIHRLDERPTRAGMLADITCDCDGRLDRFIGTPRDQSTLPLHEMNGKEYYLGVFLVGAYQETLGDLHNLLGDTNVVGVQVDGDGHIEYEREIAGDTVADVLSYVEYEPRAMIERVRRTAERAVRESRITPEERREIMASYEDGLRGYTYFEH